MSSKLHRASALALVATVFSVLASSENAGAQVQAATPQTVEAADTHAADISFISQPVVQPLPVESDEAQPTPSKAASLSQLVLDMPVEDELSDDMRCLAGAIYFESRGEPLAGQLAVGDVIINRAQSGRFPSTYCGVVYQRSQFSFVRGGRMPAIDTSSNAWRNARAIARIAHEGLWESPAEGALFFHAKSVKPRWRLTRVAQVSTHIFYR